jgi:hypothetical protein
VRVPAAAVELVEHTDDVQSRQAVVMSRALVDAWRDGFDWMLQLDIDELLYLPRGCQREHAPSYFASVPKSIDAVAFHNHEVAPIESLYISDWFDECTHFKVSDEPLRGPPNGWLDECTHVKGSCPRGHVPTAPLHPFPSPPAS